MHQLYRCRGSQHCSVNRWAAALGIVLAISRAFITEQDAVFEPELALLEVAAHTPSSLLELQRGSLSWIIESCCLQVGCCAGDRAGNQQGLYHGAGRCV